MPGPFPGSVRCPGSRLAPLRDEGFAGCLPMLSAPIRSMHPIGWPRPRRRKPKRPGRHAILIDPQFLEQRPQLLAIGAPASDRALIDRLAHLGDARGAHRATCLVKGKAGVVPFEVAVRYDLPCLCFQIGDHFLVLDLDHHALRQDAAPVGHERIVATVEAAELAEIVGVWITVLEENRETGEAGIDRVAARMDDARVRQRQVDEAGQMEVPGHLVGDAFGARTMRSGSGDVAGADLAQLLAWPRALPCPVAMGVTAAGGPDAHDVGRRDKLPGAYL